VAVDFVHFVQKGSMLCQVHDQDEALQLRILFIEHSMQLHDVLAVLEVPQELNLVEYRYRVQF